MFKPLVFARGVNILPILSHNRNMYMTIWEKTIEYEIPLMEKLDGKPEIIIKNDMMKIIFKKPLDAIQARESPRRL